VVELEVFTYGAEQAEGSFMRVFPGAGGLLFTVCLMGTSLFEEELALCLIILLEYILSRKLKEPLPA